MASRLVAWPLAGGAGIIGIGLVVASINLASGARRETLTVIADSVPRPAFSLDDRRQVTPGHVGAYEVASLSREELVVLEALTSRAARVFDVPFALLEREILRATLARDDGTGFCLAPLGGPAIRELNVPGDPATAAAARELVDFLGRDPRPFDSHLSREMELGVAARAAYLAAQHAMYATHLESLGVMPDDDTLWFLALSGTLGGNDDLLSCIEEAFAMRHERVGRAFADLEPTLRLLTDRPFVLRAFLGDRGEELAREESLAFVEHVRTLAPLFEGPMRPGALAAAGRPVTG